MPAPATARRPPPVPLPELVMFDLDGTLIDTMGYFADLAAELIHEHYGVELALARQRYLQTSGIPFRQQLDVLFPDDTRNEPTSATYEQRKTGICLRAEMPADTVEALQELQRRGLRVVLSSNSAQHFVDELVDRCPVRFDLTLGFGDGLAKGAPHVAEVERRLGVPAARILFVGDSLKDGELAERCGLRFVGITGTFRAGDFRQRFDDAVVIDRIAELPALLFGRADG